MMIRLIFWAIIIYFVFRLIQGLFLPKNPSTRQNVRGKRKIDSLDLSNMDVEDANFREIDDDEKKRP